VKRSKVPFLLRVVRWGFPKLEKVAPWLAKKYFIRIFFTPLNYKVPEKELVAEQKAEKFEVYLDKKKIQCYSWGEGPVVLVAHGWAGRATQFRKFIEPFTSAGFKVVGFDGPAHGRSDGTSTHIVEFENVHKMIFEKVGVPVAIIAHSFGGAAVLYSVMRGLPVKKLINIASPTIGDEVINTYLRAINGSQQTGNYFKQFILKRYGKPFDEFSALYFVQHLPRPVDILLVHDEDDEEVTIEHAINLMKVYPQAKLYKTKGLGHTRILKDDDVVNRCVTFVTEFRLNEKSVSKSAAS
jgi:pimeloyl-ACP methyl ester carboxylesterase